MPVGFGKGCVPRFVLGVKNPFLLSLGACGSWTSWGFFLDGMSAVFVRHEGFGALVQCRLKISEYGRLSAQAQSGASLSHVH